MREPIQMVVQMVVVEPLHGGHDLGVQLSASLVQERLVGHAMRQRVGEVILGRSCSPAFGEQLGPFQMGQGDPEVSRRQAGKRGEEIHRNILANDGRALQEALVLL